MKTIISIMIFCLVPMVMISGQEQQAQKLLSEAVYQEEINGDLDEAIKIYRSVINQYPDDRDISAEALLHLGMCYEKLGNQEAVQTYRHLVNNYPEQTNEVTVARERLARLIQIAEEVSASLYIPKFTRIQMPVKLDLGAQLSPDGKELTFSSTMYEGSLWTVPIPGKVRPDIAGNPEKLIGEDEVWAWGHTWSADGKWIAYNHMKNEEDNFVDEIHVIPSSGGEPVKIPVPVNRGGSFHIFQYSLSLSPDGKVLAYASKEEGDSDKPKESYIYTVPVKGGSAGRLTDGSTWLPAFSPDGSKIAYIKTSAEENGLWVIPSHGGRPVKVCDLGRRVWGPPIWSPGSDYIAYLMEPEPGKECKEIWFVPVSEKGESTAPPRSIELPLQAARNLGGWTFDNKIGLFLINPVHQAIYTVPSSGGKATQITPPENYAFSPGWDPGGKRIYFIYNNVFSSVASEGGKISAVPVAGEVGINYPVVSPDGKKILFHGFKKGVNGMHIWTASTEGGEATQLGGPFNDDFIEDAFPQWSPDSRTVCFYRHEKTPDGNGVRSSICLVPAEGGDVRVLIADQDSLIKEISPRSMCWSPDGKSIVYYCNKDGKIRTVPVDDGEPQVLAQLQKDIQARWLNFSPGGKEIIYKVGDKIWKITLNGEEPVEIKTGLDLQVAGPLSWSPDGEKIAFTMHKGGDIDLWMMENFMPLAKLEQKPAEDIIEPEGLKIRQIWKNNLLDDLGTVSYDGRFRSYVDWGVGNVGIHNLMTDEKRVLTDDANLGESWQFAVNTAISLDGKQIAYSWSNPYNTTALRLIDVDNPEPELLYRKTGEELYPSAWLSDNVIVASRYLPDEGSMQIVTVNIPDKAINVKKSFTMGRFGGLACSPDGKYIAYGYANEADNGNMDIRLLAANGVGELPLITHPSNDRVIGWVPGRKEFLFISDRSGAWDLWSIELDGTKPSGPPGRLYADIGEVEPMGFTRDGKCYFGFVRRNFYSGIAAFNEETGKVNLGEGKSLEGSNLGLLWSPDGQNLAYLKLGEDISLIVNDLKTGEEKEPAKDILRPWEISWSPDGNSLLVVGWEKSQRLTEGYKGGVFRVDIKTDRVDKIFLLSDYEYNIPEDDAYPLSGIEWSTDGKSFYYIFFKDRLVKHNLETGEEKILYEHPDFSRGILELSPDGKNLLFGLEYPGNEKSRLVTIPAEGGKEETICTSQGAHGIEWAKYSPDGKYIYIIELPQSTKSVLWRVPAEGGNPEKLWSPENRVEIYDIHPDGNRVTFSIRERVSEVRVIDNLVQELERLDTVDK
jgi:Tol biopolymer transport system component